MGSLTGKTALVTGAGRGLGAACAKRLALAGAEVALVSRTRSELEAVALEIEKTCGPGRTLLFPADVSDEAQVLALFARIDREWGSLDILVNNAATVEVKSLLDETSESWDRAMAVNLRGPFLLSREAFGFFSKRKSGVVVNLASLSGIRGTEKFKGLSAYIVSKHGMVGLTESLAVEGAEWGIRAYGVAPGAVDTAMLRKAAPFLKTRTTPDDVAQVILGLVDGSAVPIRSGETLEIHSNL
jgi:NAD(P)-dependent dehydrogenase (short-subunit alcohol dehydrogenase family)